MFELCTWPMTTRNAAVGLPRVSQMPNFSRFPIRKACQADRKEIRNFYRDMDSASLHQYFNGYVGQHSIDKLWDEINNRDIDHFFVIEQYGYIVGVCHLTCVNGQAEVAVLISKDHRNKGYGTALVKRAISYCKANGIAELLIYSQPSNTIMQRLIKQLDLQPLMLADPAEARFSLSTPDITDIQNEVNYSIASHWFTFVKHCLYRTFISF